MKIINITLNKKEDYINKYNEKRISPEMETYLLNELRKTNLKDKIKIEIKTKNKFTIKEQEEIINMIKSSFKDDIKEINIFNDRQFIKDIILLSLGILVLILYSLLNNFIVLSELILIIDWLLIWEGLDDILFLNYENKIRLKRRKQLIDSKIEFI